MAIWRDVPPEEMIDHTKPPAQKPWVQRYGGAEIEWLARAICENTGLDPDELVQADFDRFMLIGEFQGGYVYDVLGFRWQLYRKDAQMALATRDALVAMEEQASE